MIKSLALSLVLVGNLIHPGAYHGRLAALEAEAESRAASNELGQPLSADRDAHNVLLIRSGILMPILRVSGFWRRYPLPP